MLRKTLLVLAAAAAVTAGSTFSASAMHGGFGGGFGRGGFGGGFGRMAMAHPGGFGGGFGTSNFGVRPSADFGRRFGDRRFDFDRRFDRGFDFDRFHRFGFRHRFFLTFAFLGAFPYYDYGCLTRVWTPWGWRWRNVCY